MDGFLGVLSVPGETLGAPVPGLRSVSRLGEVGHPCPCGHGLPEVVGSVPLFENSDEIVEAVVGRVVVLVMDVMALWNRSQVLFVDLAMEEQTPTELLRSFAKVAPAQVKTDAVELLASWRENDWIHGA